MRRWTRNWSQVQLSLPDLRISCEATARRRHVVASLTTSSRSLRIRHYVCYQSAIPLTDPRTGLITKCHGVYPPIVGGHRDVLCLLWTCESINHQYVFSAPSTQVRADEALQMSPQYTYS